MDKPEAATTRPAFTSSDVAGEAVDIKPPAPQLGDPALERVLQGLMELAPETQVLFLEPGATYLVLLPPGVPTQTAQGIGRMLHAMNVKGCLARVDDPRAIRLLKIV